MLHALPLFQWVHATFGCLLLLMMVVVLMFLSLFFSRKHDRVYGFHLACLFFGASQWKSCEKGIFHTIFIHINTLDMHVNATARVDAFARTINAILAPGAHKLGCIDFIKCSLCNNMWQPLVIRIRTVWAGNKMDSGYRDRENGLHDDCDLCFC